MRAGERFLCPACEVPFSTARGGSRTDHFVHPPGQPTGSYHAMTVAHFEAQLRLYRWAQSLGLQARLEQVIEGGVRRTDLLVTLGDGSQVALEVQYSGLTIEAWRARHRDYRARGITDVWLWHLDLPPATGPDPLQVQLPAVQQAAVHQGLPVLWICADGQVGTGYRGRPCAEEVDDWTSSWWQPVALEHIGLRLPNGSAAEVAVEPLAGCTLTADGLLTPMLSRIHQERAALQAKAAPLQQQAAEAERARQAQLAAVLAERNAHKDLERARAFLEQTRIELEQRLPAAAYRQLAHPTHASHQVQVTPAQLHALVYGILRRMLPRGWEFTRRRLKHSCHVVGVTEAVPYGVSAAVDAFLERLADQHMIRIDPPDGRILPGPAFNRWETPQTPHPVRPT
jgi:AcrR family transcriptional regulator